MPSPHVTAVEDDAVVWRLPDPDATVHGVRLWSDFDLGSTEFAPVSGGWQLRRPRRSLPAVHRLEYLFEVNNRHETWSILDPGNPLRVGGAFGDHSWVSLDYQPPSWLDVEPVPGHREPLMISGTPVGEVDVQVWSPLGTPADEPLPLLLSHDGPEMDALGGLTHFIGAMITLRQAQGTGGLPPMRVGLLAPGARNERYGANRAYADTLCEIVVPALRTLAPSHEKPVLMGQSLGALAALQAEWTHPGTFSGLLLQSGSFFTAGLDGHESGFAQWLPVTSFVTEVHGAQSAPSVLPIGVCFGSAEENAANNRLMAAKLAALGNPVTVGEVRDGHTFTCWRDLLDPNLLMTLRQAQGA